MIKSAKEFVRLRNSTILEEYNRAAQEEAPDEVWLEIINKYPEMKKWVAHNKKIPLFILDILAKDKNRRVRSTVARKRKLSYELYDLLSKDSCESIRLAIAANPKVPKEILESMLTDEWEDVVETVKERLAEIESKLHNK